MEKVKTREEKLLRRRQRERARRASETAEERERRLRQRRDRDRVRRASQSSEERRARLQQLRDRQQERLATESAEERQDRLHQVTARQRERRTRETAEERQARLRGLSDHQRERLASETAEERQVRLRGLSDHQRERLASQTAEERQARLHRLRTSRQDQLATETPEERELRLQQDRERHREQRSVQRQAPLFEQASVQAKMKKFHSQLATIEVHQCANCFERFAALNTIAISTEGESMAVVCVRCHRDNRIPKLYSSANNMNPGPVPSELQGLTQAEEMLISAVMPIMSIYHLPQGQYGYSGHVINLPQDVASFATSLPRLPSELDVVIIRKEGANQSHRDFRVMRHVVQRALQWLVMNNQYYRANQVHIDQEALAQLPQDGNVSDCVSAAVESPSATDQLSSMTEDEDPHTAHLARSFVPIAARSMTEQETIRSSVQQRQSDRPSSATSSTLMWPSIGGTPLNEFTTEGYFSCAFPTLFPTGAADFLGPRQNQITIGNYFKHLMMYDDGRFAKHPRFRFFALNTEMRWRALQAGRIYVRQHPGDAQLSVDELRDMVGREGEAFSNRVLHYASSLRGTRQYWFKQRSRLISMVDTLGLPTVFFTHSAADLQWPELARLICPEDADSRTSRTKAVIENPLIADWFFYHRVQKFVEAFYVGVLGVTDYWLRFEWQHRGSPHIHGLAWLPNAPDVEKHLSPPNSSDQDKQIITQYADSIVSTYNPAVLPDGSNVDDAPGPKTDPHVCNKSYSEVEDFQQDLTDLVATCQRHTRCSPAYCLRTQNGRQACRFGYPKPLQPTTALITDESEPALLTARNDGMVNSFNPLQLSAWRANVDMQYIVSRYKVIEYCTKYVTKSEPRSQSLKEIFTSIVRSLKDGNTSLKAVQKLLINSVGERDYSAQETCHLLLQLPMFKASRDFIILSLDGSRAVEDRLQEEQRATVPSIFDHYLVRPTTEPFDQITLLEFARQYSMPRSLGAEPTRRSKRVIVIARPYCSPEPSGPKYEQYCLQSLMQHKPFRRLSDLLAEHPTYASSYAVFLQSSSVPPSLNDDIQRLEQQSPQHSEDDNTQENNVEEQTAPPARHTDEWMLICRQNADVQPSMESQQDVNWTQAAQYYPNLEEAPSFISQQRQAAGERIFTTSADPLNLQGKQLEVYTTVHEHARTGNPSPLLMIVSGTAGTGKSYLIQCLRLLLEDQLHVAAPTGGAACNVDGHTLHSLLSLPTKRDFKDLEGDRLHQLQQSLSAVKYLIIDEMSMVGRKTLGQVDRRLRQIFPHRGQKVFGGCSCLLFGDFGQLPPVMDLPLYTTISRTELSDQGRNAYQQFDKAFVLDQVMRQAGQDPQQVLFREILLRLRDAKVTVADWTHLMTQTATNVQDVSPFANALHLHPTVEAVVEHNVAKLRSSGKPIATIKAVHTGPNASKAPPDDAGGLEAVICLTQSARVMLTSNLWVDVGLVNGAMGTIVAICYRRGGPPDLPIAVMVHFDKYSGPTLHDGTVPITPIRRTWSSAGTTCSRLQLPLKLAWAVTVHKSQGLTLDKVVVDIGKREFSAGLTFVACSRVRQLRDLLFIPPFPYERLANLANSQRLQQRIQEDQRLLSLEPRFHHEAPIQPMECS